ncbi:MAG TPA: AI-2E family transporter, partial [Burkholderiaceae bacterium]|nr:AI-2E family transporter [Burkholderiaceae bacterium]
MTRPPVGAASWQRPLLSVVLIALAWHLREAIILFFGAVLVAATLHALADPLVRRGLLGPRAALATVVAAVISGLAIGLWLLGDPLAQQLQALRVELPKAWTALHEWLQRTQVGVRVLAAMGDLGDLQVPWARIANVAGSTLRVLGEVVLMLLIGLYLASDTRLYREALLRLVPAQRRPAAADAIDVTGEALKRWLLGQAVAM